MDTRTRRIIWTHSAQQALEEVLTFIAGDSVDGAARVLERTLEAAESLSAFAERGRVVPEIGEPTLREVFIYGYRLLYRVYDYRVVVTAFLHGARDFASWRKEGDTEI